jgi:hypothetical protein
MGMNGGLRIGAATLSGLLVLSLSVAAAHADSTSQSFATAGEHAFVVPPGVTSVQVALVGGYGGVGSGGIPGGIPASAGATLSVSPGETLYAEVAGDGEAATGVNNLGGYNGGGTGGTNVFLFASYPGGGGGGGASDVRLCPTSAAPAECGGRSSLASRLLVAAGGGGGGGNGLSPSSTAGGDGGASDQSGSGGAYDAHSDAGGGGRQRASTTSGGVAGASGVCEPMSGGGCSAKGELGSGGSAGTSAAGTGGGGGGGIFGGGGGGAGDLSNIGTPQSPVIAAGGGGGGGGGSSGIVAGATGVSGFSLVPTAEGARPAVTFTWTPAPPAVVTVAPSAVTVTTATLNGSVNPDAWQIVSCGFAISPAPAGVASFPCSQQLTAGSTPTAVSAIAAGLNPGTTYTVTLTAASTEGASTGEPITLTTAPASAGTGPPGTGSSQALTVTNLRLVPARFRGGKRAATIAKRKTKALPTATTISFGLSAAASVKLGFETRKPGVLAAGRCTAPSKTHRKGKRCVRYVAIAGAVTLPAAAGADKIAFDGVLDGGRRLAPGTYRLSLSATAGTALAQAAQHPTFTLLA